MVETSTLTFDCLEPLRGSVLTLCADGAGWDADLTELERLPKYNPDADRDPFTFSLRVPAAGLAQGTYGLRHDSLPDSLAVFLVPIAGDDASTTLQAVFN